ncbi:hypothetical protein Bbelb_394830 [Branchiostoma belcheri]|nr:hypothetical protein Bbelb_394830 [Branchiostoma belcheri]
MCPKLCPVRHGSGQSPRVPNCTQSEGTVWDTRRVSQIMPRHGLGQGTVRDTTGVQALSHSVLWGYFMFVRANTTGTYDVFLATLCRKEEEPSFFGMLGKALLFMLFPEALLFQIATDAALSQVAQVLARGNITADDEDLEVLGSIPTPVTDLVKGTLHDFPHFTQDVSLIHVSALALSRGTVPKDLGDKIIEFEFVEDLIEKGFLIPNGDDSQMTLKFE